MKKNYFYTAIQEELSLLRNIAFGKSRSEVTASGVSLLRCHESFMRRLFREFITPLDRKDLYAVSRSITQAAICFGSNFPDSRPLREAVRTLAEAPLRFDEGILLQYGQFLEIRKTAILSASEEQLFRLLDDIYQAVINASLGGV